MHIAIFGASRPMGAQAAALALQRGHTVSVVSRSGASDLAGRAGVSIVKGDATVEGDVRSAVEKADAVLSFLGGGMKNSKDALPNARFAKLITKALRDDIPFVTVSNIGASPESLAHQSPLYRWIAVPLYMKPILEDKREMEATLKSSSLKKWAALRCAQLTDAEPDASKVVVKVDDTISVVSNRTKRGDVSIVALDLVEGKRDDMWGQTPAVISP
ncbi:NAD(P)-binding domain-containing protein [Plasmodiophora brassicae]|uniref:NAD(P)-binding domain-containing protein n=1 Tax=Plasmodiophora brassicae TaxID=37360 RepID=A0A0G4IJN0_PLABS|nr:hypothetical protein PBRA_004053 [Plasmodiophora brassicae]